jgi:hypothetical protein
MFKAILFWLRGRFLDLVGWLAGLMGAKLAVATGSVASIAIVTGLFVAAIHAAAAGVTAVFPTGAGFLLGLIPASVYTFIGVYFSARLITWVYVANVQAIQLTLKF